MNAAEADDTLESCSAIFRIFAQRYGMRIGRNTHFEGVNRVLEWSEGLILKSIVVEFTYTDKPTFVINVKAFKKDSLYLHRYGGWFRYFIPLKCWHKQIMKLDLPCDRDKLDKFLENARSELENVRTADISGHRDKPVQRKDRGAEWGS